MHLVSCGKVGHFSFSCYTLHLDMALSGNTVGSRKGRYEGSRITTRAIASGQPSRALAGFRFPASPPSRPFEFNSVYVEGSDGPWPARHGPWEENMASAVVQVHVQSSAQQTRRGPSAERAPSGTINNVVMAASVRRLQ